MSTNALNHACTFPGLTPNEKLILMLLAHVHRPGQVLRPSRQWLATMSGLALPYVSRTLENLVKRGVVKRDDKGYVLPGADPKPTDLIPADWWPSEKAITALLSAHPDHDFDMKEAVNDFVTFTRSRALAIGPDARDAAFIRNVSHLLSLRPVGPTRIGISGAGTPSNSVRAVLSGMPLDGAA